MDTIYVNIIRPVEFITDKSALIIIIGSIISIFILDKIMKKRR